MPACLHSQRSGCLPGPGTVLLLLFYRAAASPVAPAALESTDSPQLSYPTVLGVTESSCGLADVNEALIRGLEAKCNSYPKLAIIINFFDALTEDNSIAVETRVLPPNLTAACQDTASTSLLRTYSGSALSLPGCVVGITRVRGFKMRFFREVLPPSVTERYDFLWTFDNDIGVSENGGINVQKVLHQMTKAKVNIAQPRVLAIGSSVQASVTHPSSSPPAAVAAAAAAAGAAAGMPSGGAVAKRSGEDFPSTSAASPMEPEGCLAQAMDWVESRATHDAQISVRAQCSVHH